ncbi:MAG: glycosyltransferase family 39 protein [Burkholderiaceae bacterium]|jgi:4-amino-4-deoxy-L-arabinose transferase-like glycosyltransferase|nr:glycosyltransferase family 39 protein [Burkholderiaceae bacterium]
MTAPDTPRASALRGLVAHPLPWLLLLAAAHVAVRVALSPALKWDEAEQMLWSQQLALGYGAQPPLYTWLQWGVNQVLGPSVLALSLLKHVLIALACVFMWLAGRELLGPRGAWWAAASLLALPPLGWFSIRDQTHTVLVTALTCGAWWLLLRLARRPRPVEFAGLGLVCGLAMLAKYSFALVAAAMLLAALSAPASRRALLARGWWWAPLAGMLVALPHAVWLASHLHEATAATLEKMQIQPERYWGEGLLNLLDACAGTLGLWALIALWAFRSACWRAPAEPQTAWVRRLFGRYLILIGLALLGMTLLAGVTQFKGRWVLPLLCVTPLAALAARPALQDHPRAGRYTGALAALALILLAAGAARPWVSGLRGQMDALHYPAVALEAALRADGYDGQGRIVAADHILAGTLRTRFPQAAAQACEPSRQAVPPCVAAAIASAQRAGQGWLLVSHDYRAAPDWWEQAATAVPGLTARSIALPLTMMRPGTAPARYRYSWHPADATSRATIRPP